MSFLLLVGMGNFDILINFAKGLKVCKNNNDQKN